MFALEVRYLMGRAWAGDYSDRREPEWPPHPARLYSALVCACFDTGMGEAGEEALRWLERQGPAQISAGDAGGFTRYTGFVPTNYVDKNGIHTKQPRAFPAVTPKDDRVCFIWPDASPSAEVRDTLDEMAARVGYLGKSPSFVQMKVTDDPRSVTHIPAADGDTVMRVAAEGRLDELKRLYAADRWDPYTNQQRYRRVLSGGEARPHPGFWSEMIVFRRAHGYAFTSEATLTVTDMLRQALMSQAGRNGKIPDILQGHEGARHCAFVALPFVGRDYADGHLLGCAILLPRGCDSGEAAEARKTAAGLEEIDFKRPALDKWRVEIAEGPGLPQTLQRATWAGSSTGSKTWSSVTPLLLDSFPKKRLPVEEIVARSCERAGLPRPVDVQHGPWSCVKGVPPVPAFRLLRSKEDRPRWGVHVTLTFDANVGGPMVLGAGRYFGLGLMRPEGSDENR